MATTPPSEARWMTVEEIDALPIGSVVMTVTDPEHFGLYEQRVWEKHGGTREWQFGSPRKEWQSTDGGFQRTDVEQRHRALFATNRKVIVLFVPDADTSAAIGRAHDDFTRAQRGRERHV
ncbi:hypothetical protein [Microbacterium sp. cx-59]|uniref:hypothetical protein n=1 Tax=Microbacterium sp. cx-59 TaxID=2891207 RepID=UPI001E501DCD|nr:hypothetical protein [Microbacterium sp. cx-59]MCC4906949.1 hypothetical protein [Microbacterium sp. cx-59]